jgi:tetratricopeptide (TPR) repeat protein
VINYFYLVLIYVLTLAAHELGHAAAGKALGFKIYGITIGNGPVLFKSKALGFPFTVHLAVFSAKTYLASPTDHHLRLRRWLTTLAGPATHALVLGAISASLGWGFMMQSIRQFSITGPEILGWLITVNLALLIGSLLPFRFLGSGGVRSDGYRLITIPILSETQFAAYRAGYLEMEARELMLSKRYADAIELYERALKINPNGLYSALGLHAAYLELRNYARAREWIVSLLARDDIGKGPLRTTVLNNIAWTDVMLDDPDLLDEADRCSAEAIAKKARYPYYKGTRGAVLVSMGKYEEGIGLLSEAYRRHTAKTARGSVAYWAAIGEARRGNRNEAETWLKRAVQNYPDDALRQRAEVEVGLGGIE